MKLLPHLRVYITPYIKIGCKINIQNVVKDSIFYIYNEVLSHFKVIILPIVGQLCAF